MVKEEWRDIEEFKGLYQISNLGKVRSLERHINTRTYPSQIMKSFVGNNNCVMVRLRQKGKKQVKRSVAKLVLMAFVGKPPDIAKSVKHIDGDPRNNCIDNLAWDVCEAYYMPENYSARNLFIEKAPKMVDIYITKKCIKKSVNFWFCDVDDFKQMCLLKIWRYIDAYTDDVNFYTFCRTKCDDVLKTLYAKEIKKNSMVIRFEDMVTEKRPIDCIPELAYIEKFVDMDKSSENGGDCV